MLVTLKEILRVAEKKQCAIGSFNTPNLESIMSVMAAAEELEIPVILQHAQVHESLMPLSVIGPIMMDFAHRAQIPVCVHLDHGETLNYIEQAIKIGFTSVMYDGSLLPFKENMDNTRLVVQLAHKEGVSVEAELGSMGKRETGARVEMVEEDAAKIYTDPEQAKRFVEETGIDALACSFGTSHGIYLKRPKLNMDILERVEKNVEIPLVMHGGSGVSEEDYRMAISKGIRKVNYYTYMARAGGISVERFMSEKKDEPILYHDIVDCGMKAMKEDVKQAMKIFTLKCDTIDIR